MPIALSCALGICFFSVFATEPVKTEISERMPLAANSLLTSLAHAGNTLVAVGERGHVLLSDDCGRKWRQVTVPTRVLLTSVFFLDAKQGWAVGHDSVILRTRDGGRNWAKVHEDIKLEKPLLDVWFEDARHGFAVGAYGLFLETRDGGTSWQTRAISQDDFHLYSISVVPGKAWFIAGESGSVYRSTDQGKQWVRASIPYQGTFFGSMVAAQDRVLVYGMRGRVFASDDLGQNWKSVSTGILNALEAGLYVHDKQLLLAGHDGVVLQSRDNGNHFQVRRLAGRVHFSSLKQCDSHWLLAGEHGVREWKP